MLLFLGSIYSSSILLDPCNSFYSNPFIIWVMYSVLDLPLPIHTSHSITVFSRLSCHKMSPIIFLLLDRILFYSCRFSFTLFSTSSFIYYLFGLGNLEHFLKAAHLKSFQPVYRRSLSRFRNQRAPYSNFLEFFRYRQTNAISSRYVALTL